MLRLVGLYCALTDFCMGRKETERMDIMWEKEKCFAGQLSKKYPIHYFPLRAVRAPGPADRQSLAGRPAAGHYDVCVCVCTFTQTQSGLFSGCVHSKKTGTNVFYTAVLHSVSTCPFNTSCECAEYDSGGRGRFKTQRLPLDTVFCK